MRTLISEIAAVGLAVYCRPHEHQMQELKKNILAELYACGDAAVSRFALVHVLRVALRGSFALLAFSFDLIACRLSGTLAMATCVVTAEVGLKRTRRCCL